MEEEEGFEVAYESRELVEGWGAFY
jgi:hypothetical protein